MKALAKVEKVHEYLEEENHYEVNSVKKGQTNKTCEHCGKTIEKGIPHDVHKFYPEFASYPTHKNCTTDFIASLQTEENKQYLPYQHLLKDK